MLTKVKFKKNFINVSFQKVTIFTRFIHSNNSTSKKETVIDTSGKEVNFLSISPILPLTTAHNLNVDNIKKIASNLVKALIFIVWIINISISFCIYNNVDSVHCVINSNEFFSYLIISEKFLVSKVWYKALIFFSMALSTLIAYVKFNKLLLVEPYNQIKPIKYLFVFIQVIQGLLSTFMLTTSSVILFILSGGEKFNKGILKSYDLFSIMLKPPFEKISNEISSVTDIGMQKYILENYTNDSLKKRYETGFETPEQLLNNLKIEHENQLRALADKTTKVDEKVVSWVSWIYNFGCNHTYLVTGIVLVIVGGVSLFAYSSYLQNNNDKISHLQITKDNSSELAAIASNEIKNIKANAVNRYMNLLTAEQTKKNTLYLKMTRKKVNQQDSLIRINTNDITIIKEDLVSVKNDLDVLKKEFYDVNTEMLGNFKKLLAYIDSKLIPTNVTQSESKSSVISEVFNEISK